MINQSNSLQNLDNDVRVQAVLLKAGFINLNKIADTLQGISE